MTDNTIYDNDELKLKLLKFSKYKIIDEESKNIKSFNIKKKLLNYKNELNHEQKYITIFIFSANKIVMKYDERIDKLDLKFFDQYLDEKDNLRIIIYLFDTSNNSNEYIDFSNMNENIKFKIEFKNYISIFSKFTLLLSGFFTMCFTFFTIYALSEYGIPIMKMMDFHVIVILQICTILFFILLCSLSTIIVIFLFIPCLIYYIGIHHLFILFIIQIGILIISIWFLKKYYLYTLSKLPLFIIKIFLHLTVFFSAFLSLMILFIMSQSILSSIFPLNKLYDKSGYFLAIEQYSTRFSGYPKILNMNEKKYYVPIIDSNYYYIYDIDKSKKLFISSIKNEKQKSILASICTNDNTKREFQKNYIFNNPYIKPQFLTEKISIKDSNIELQPLDFNILISLEEINSLCENLK